MNRNIKKLISQLSEKPKTLFLIDSLGAFLTIFFLFVVIRNLNQYFGVPTSVLTYLAVIASLFCVYSATCFLVLEERWVYHVKTIGIANLLYCVLIIGVVINNNSSLTALGRTYFLLEVLVIYGLSYVELRVARELKNAA
jgi:hypothetical protein